MRTESRDVLRNSSEQTLGDDGSVSADAGVVSGPVGVFVGGPPNSDALVQTSIDVDAFDTLLDSHNGRDIGMMDMLDTVSDGIMMPDTQSHGIMNVDASFHYTNV